MSLFIFLGILIWFPVPFMRNVPITLAKKLGEITANYRWFAIVYIVASFFLIPLFIFLISLAGWYWKKRQSNDESLFDFFRYVFLGVFSPLALIIFFVIIVNILQVHVPKWLPNQLQTWLWLPRPLRSLGWYDEYIFNHRKRLLCCKRTESVEPDIVANRNIRNNSAVTINTFDDDIDRLSGITTRL